MIPHYISEDMLALLAAGAGEDTLDQGQILYSDRVQANITGQFLLSKNRKSILWTSPAGNVVIFTVKNQSDFIADDKGNLTSADLRFEQWNLWKFIPGSAEQLRVSPENRNNYITFFLESNELAAMGTNGKKVTITSLPPGQGLTQLQLTDDGNLIITRGGKAIWNLFTQPGTSTSSVPIQPGAMMPVGFNLGSLLVPALGLALLLYLKK